MQELTCDNIKPLGLYARKFPGIYTNHFRMQKKLAEYFYICSPTFALFSSTPQFLCIILLQLASLIQ